MLPLRRSANVKHLIERLFGPEGWTRATDASQCWQAIEDSLKPMRRSRARRVGVLRRRIQSDLAPTFNQKSRKGRSEPGQLVLALSADEVQDNAQMSKYTVLANVILYKLAAIGQLYRDRCDCRACQVSRFDELKKQWGCGSFTMQHVHRSQLGARAGAHGDLVLTRSWS